MNLSDNEKRDVIKYLESGVGEDLWELNQIAPSQAETASDFFALEQSVLYQAFNH